MSSLIQEASESHLSAEKLKVYLDLIKSKLQGRVREAYVFGSASEQSISPESDIDLILVKDQTTEPFVKRAFEFLDLFEIFPRLDILVYTPEELAAQLADSDTGFWKSVRLSMKKII
jgi:predicted nucleotidyltransferase